MCKRDQPRVPEIEPPRRSCSWVRTSTVHFANTDRSVTVVTGRSEHPVAGRREAVASRAIAVNTHSSAPSCQVLAVVLVDEESAAGGRRTS